MRFFVLIISCTLLVTATRAQVQFSFFAGPQVTSAAYTVKGIDQDTKMKYGFHAGISLKVPFEDKLYFAPAAFYSLKGYKVNFNAFAFPPSLMATDNNTTLHTFELAALLQYDFSAAPAHFFVKAGPALDFQLFGKEKFNMLPSGSVERDMNFSYTEYGHFAASLEAHFGYEMASGITISLNYAHGVGSINNADGGPSIKHRVFGLTFGKILK